MQMHLIRASVERQKVKCFLIFSNIYSDPLIISLLIDITQTNYHCQYSVDQLITIVNINVN